MPFQVIPFKFKSNEVRTIMLNNQPWFIAMDVSNALSYTDTQAMTRKLDADEVQTRQIVGFGNRGALIINESGLYSAILRSRKKEAKLFKKWVTSEVLPSIREHGIYTDEGNQLNTLIGHTIGTDGFHCLAAVLDGKLRLLPNDDRKRIKNHIWSQVHKAFSVVSAQDIPACKLDSARNFIASYAIEGEWLPKTKKTDCVEITREQAHKIHLLVTHSSFFHKRWHEGISEGVKAINRDLWANTYEHVESLARASKGLSESLHHQNLIN